MNYFKNLKLKWKLAIGFSIPLSLLILISAIVYHDLNKLIKSTESVNHTHEVIESAKGISESLLKMEAGFL